MTKEQFTYLSPKIQIILCILSLFPAIVLVIWWLGVLMEEASSLPPWYLYISIVTGVIAILLPDEDSNINEVYDIFFGEKK